MRVAEVNANVDARPVRSRSGRAGGSLRMSAASTGTAANVSISVSVSVGISSISLSIGISRDRW